ncbi:hypothetical protein DENIS_3219 [Desulfonema ishimotonii]|uniref:Restriction endonuclease type IV Mrr domain-containing protein n=1 Tax=Desulfonema ishimotonii TaxID=45657 RepID=A0A401FZ69_9BACT|nr:hypothetical protein [Desulfonema ishimotonii]GBC62250.1 hypothetical protein DENIS_3219 [Desulfonema ishimotonii]
MPTFSNMNILPPKHWDEFENITLSALRIRWSNPNLTKHGRQGQPQNGVDIYGYDSSGGIVGVQCKQTLKTINNKLIETEIKKADSFIPTLSEFYIATTAPADVNLQRQVRLISEKRSSHNKFPVSILFWDDIIQDLIKDIDEFRKYYPQYQSINEKQEIDIRRRDISNLKMALSQIHLETLDEHIKAAPDRIIGIIFYFWERFKYVIESKTFYIYDEKLYTLLKNIYQNWGESLSYYHRYYNTPSCTDCYFSTENITSDKKKKDDWKAIEAAIQNLDNNINVLICYIRQEYLEIDIDELSRGAFQEYINFKKETQLIF